MVKSKLGQRFLGLFLLALGIWFTVDSWQTALNEGYYYRKAVALFPAFALIGLTVLLFPIDVEKIRAEHGVDKPTKFHHFPLPHKIMFFVAVAAGIANWIAISHR